MAEIILGRIKFVWKGIWASNTEYFRDDVIRHGGRTYICIFRHTSTTSFDADAVSSWTIISDGIEWKDNWQISTDYKINDIVSYNGIVYIANTAHTSSNSEVIGLNSDIEKWDKFSEGFQYRNNWQTDTIYRLNDLVLYNSNLYICTTQHQSVSSAALGIESNIGNWDLFSSGFSWQYSWSPGYRYIYNDVIKYGGKVYICNTGHTSATTDALGLEADQDYWDVFHNGVEFLGDWTTDYRYKENDLVKYGGGIWICTTYHTSQTTFNELNWEQFIEGLEFENSWTSTKSYQAGDLVTYGGYIYVAITNNLDKKPFNFPEVWDLFSTGFKFAGEWGEDSSLQEYRVGDVVTVNGYTYVCILDHANQMPPNITYWERLNSGIFWRSAWADGIAYNVGDSVRFGDSSYICIQGHLSDETVDQNRPDQTTGTGNAELYWDLLSGGVETSVITTEGDLLYYSGAGPARLPIGLSGQSLMVDPSGNFPIWKYAGSLNNIFYVEANSGIDSPAPFYGITLNQPWKTIRYATEQILNGTMYPNARYLIELNRSFIQEEVVEWVAAQIAAGSGIWNGFINDNVTKCRRDIGQIIDAIVHDMSHGGNVKIREATLSYFDNDGNFISEIADEAEQLKASLDFMTTVIDNVISNLTPSSVYSTFNQFKDITIAKEVDAQERIENLLSILTNALVAGSGNGVPNKYNPNNTIFVKTGEFSEVLPIIVPENTAIVGDELRSTRVTAASKIVSDSEVTYTLQTIQKIRDIIPDIITNNPITNTPGNLLTQNTSRVAGTLGSINSYNSINTLSTEIIDILENGLSAVDAISWSDPGVVTARLYTRQILQLNRSFIITELTNWISSQISSSTTPFTNTYTYDQVKCERDTGYIIDAISYDIQYNTNWGTVLMSKNYYEGAVASLPSEEVAPTVAAFDQLSSIMEDITTGVYAGQNTNGGNVGTSTEASVVFNKIQIIKNIIDDGNLTNLPSVVYPDITWATTELQQSYAEIDNYQDEIADQVVSYVKVTYSTLNFDHIICNRDADLIITALKYDLVLGTNYQSLISGILYYKNTTSTNKVLNEQLNPTVDGVKFLQEKIKFISYNGPGLRAKDLMQTIYDNINFSLNNTGTKRITFGSETPKTDTETTYALEAIEINRNFIVAEAIAFIENSFSDTATATTTGSNIITISDTSWLVQGTKIKFSGTVFGGIVDSITYYVSEIVDATTFKISTTADLNNEVSLTTDTGSMNVALSYSVTSCERDVNTFLNAIKNDIIYLGNYRSVLSATYYSNAVTGSKLENMFLVRNATGLRNMSFLGLDGTSDGNVNGFHPDGLSTANIYGTKRPLANAFVSLDPGWNPLYSKSWITTKSPYVQNVSTFGTSCIGLKVDGSLHDGGNDSIVANDFTQIISDGIGFWVTNLGRSELVSVFTYYNYIGYLAENGGKVRATNGNNSYGTYGSVSEGVDITEIPVTGTVDNRSFTATVARVISSGQIYTLEYENAGVNYTALGTTITIVGDGYGEFIDSPQVVNGGVYQVRLIDLDDSSGSFGGNGYVISSNIAQTGNATSITLANTEVILDSQAVGLRIFISSGTGVGQYGYVHSYNPNTKLAQVYKDSDGTPGWDHVVPGTTIETLLDGTTAYELEPRLVFSDSDTYPNDYSKNAKARAIVQNDQITKVLIWDPGEGYTSPPSITIIDPNNTQEAPMEARIGDGVLTQPTWIGRGFDHITVSAEISGDGYADYYQPGTNIRVKGLTSNPLPGSNVEFSSMPGKYYKLVVVRSLVGSGIGNSAPYTAQLQLSPPIEIADAPEHDTSFELRIRYSQIRLTGHDFLDIGTGNFNNTNYPGIPFTDPNPDNETVEFAGGRTFYTSTDQDGNFRVGDLFSVEQATGVATLNADAFNVSGLQELSLGELGLGSTGATINEFSTDGTFTANSDSIVPTQKAIKTYITSQIGGGSSTLNVNTLTAGQVLISGHDITTVTNRKIIVNTKMDFPKGVDGVPVAMNLFIKS